MNLFVMTRQLRFMRNNKGAVLALVLGIVFAVTCMLTALMRVPGGLRRIVLLNENRLQHVYDDESAILANLSGIPKDYFEQESWKWNLPLVTQEMRGLWMSIAAEHVSALAGIFVEDTSLVPMGQRRMIADGVRTILKNEILRAENLQTKSGNRRLFGEARDLSLQVLDGDLYLDLSGHAACGNFYASGSLTLKGSAVFDTLRLYSLGPLKVAGQVSARYLEAYSGDAVELPRDFKFSGLVVGPSTFVTTSNLLPAFIDGKLVPFQWVYE